MKQGKVQNYETSVKYTETREHNTFNTEEESTEENTQISEMSQRGCPTQQNTDFTDTFNTRQDTTF